jgi:hypothetical protein
LRVLSKPFILMHMSSNQANAFFLLAGTLLAGLLLRVAR